MMRSVIIAALVLAPSFAVGQALTPDYDEALPAPSATQAECLPHLKGPEFWASTFEVNTAAREMIAAIKTDVAEHGALNIIVDLLGGEEKLKRRFVQMVNPRIPVALGADIPDLIIAEILGFKFYKQPQEIFNTTTLSNANLQASEWVTKWRTKMFNKETWMKFIPAPSTCEWLSNTKMAKALREQLRKWAREHDIAFLDRGLNMFDSLDNEVGRARRHRDKFCSRADVDNGFCDSVGEAPNLDMSAANFLVSDGKYENELARQAAKLFVENVVGLSSVPIPEDILGTDRGREFQAERQSIQSMKSIAHHALSKVFKDKDATMGVHGESPYSALMKDVIDRYGNKDWLKKISDENAPPATLQRENLVMDTSQLKLEQENVNNQRTIITLLGALVAAEADKREARLMNQVTAPQRSQR